MWQQVEKKGGGGAIPRILPTLYMQCPHPHGVIKCLSSSAESVSKMYQLSRVSSCHLWDYICPPTNLISMVKKISLYFKLELVSFRICHIFRALCLCWLYRNLLSITSCRSLEFSFLLQLMTLSPSFWVDWLQRINKLLANYILPNLSLRLRPFFTLSFMQWHSKVYV